MSSLRESPDAAKDGWTTRCKGIFQKYRQWRQSRVKQDAVAVGNRYNLAPQEKRAKIINTMKARTLARMTHEFSIQDHLSVFFDPDVTDPPQLRLPFEKVPNLLHAHVIIMTSPGSMNFKKQKSNKDGSEEEKEGHLLDACELAAGLLGLRVGGVPFIRCLNGMVDEHSRSYVAGGALDALPRSIKYKPATSLEILHVYIGDDLDKQPPYKLLRVALANPSCTRALVNDENHFTKMERTAIRKLKQKDGSSISRKQTKCLRLPDSKSLHCFVRSVCSINHQQSSQGRFQQKRTT